MLKFLNRGNTVANNSPAAQPVASAPAKIRTWGDLSPIQEKTLTKHEFSMRRWAIERVARLLGVTSDQVVIDDLVDIRPRLKRHLESLRYRRESVRSLCDSVQRIVHDAKEHGWTPSNAEVRAAWEEICQ